MSTNSISVYAFSPTSLKTRISALCGAKSILAIPQVEYLASYLQSIATLTTIEEKKYIDRHYMEEYGRYYSRCIEPPENYAARLHFFSSSFDQTSFEQSLKNISAYPESLAEVQTDLSSCYLGFIVVRPIPSVPIARTVLRPLEDSALRHFDCTVEYDVFLAGLHLSLKGLAFQQQDRAVAACATTAVWTALQRLCKYEGLRSPTPAEITVAATQHLLVAGRAFPSKGLSVEQILDSLNSLGFAPECFLSGSKVDHFRIVTNAYIRSGIPVILILRFSSGIGHAVTVLGYREIDGPMPSYTPTSMPAVAVENLRFDQVYIHDDRLGPYARASYTDGTIRGKSVMYLRIDWPMGVETSLVDTAVVPLYPKIRTSALELHDIACQFGAVLMRRGYSNVGFEICFSRCGNYTNDLFNHSIVPERTASFLLKCALSRYVGILRWYIDGVLAFDTIWDTTDTFRLEDVCSRPMAIVAVNASYVPLVDSMATYLGCISG